MTHGPPFVRIALFVIMLPLIHVGLLSGGTPSGKQWTITDYAALGDDSTMNTRQIQSVIDKLAEEGGGTVVVPEGVFLSGALFFKPGVHLHLERGAVLKCPTDMKHFPEQRTRIEGHFEESFNPALINVDGCDGFQLTGEGTLDGDGREIWDEFWKRRNAAEDRRNFRNLDVPRARLCIIENSRNVLVRGITFKDSQFWNLHIYNSREVTVDHCRFVVPDDYKQVPSSDGVDIDSSRDITVSNCYFSVTDDCIALKGTKGPFALEDETSPPVERISVKDCVFLRGHGAVTCGSEATVVRDVVVENCEVRGNMPLVRFKLRPDTPQTYENFTVRNITMDDDGAEIFEIKKWTQYFDLQGQPEPTSHVRNIRVSGIEGRIGSLGVIEGNAKTRISGITLEDVDVRAKNRGFKVGDRVKGLTLRNVRVNGASLTLE